MKVSKKENKIRDALKTRMDLLFIRQLRNSGYDLKSDYPNGEMNLLYDFEREEHFRAKKQKVEVVKKKGPRQILNPDKTTLEFKVELDAHRFSKEEFKESLENSI